MSNGSLTYWEFMELSGNKKHIPVKPYFLPYGKISLEEHDSISETRFTIMKFDKKEWQGPVTATIINGLA